MAKQSFKEEFCRAAYSKEGSITLETIPGEENNKYRIILWGRSPLTEWYVDSEQAWSKAFDKILKIFPRTLYADSTAVMHEMGNTARSKYTIHDNRERCMEDHPCMQENGPKDLDGCYPYEIVVLDKAFWDKIVQLMKEK